jgi:hypothetical protein
MNVLQIFNNFAKPRESVYRNVNGNSGNMRKITKNPYIIDYSLYPNINKYKHTVYFHYLSMPSSRLITIKTMKEKIYVEKR